MKHSRYILKTLYHTHTVLELLLSSIAPVAALACARAKYPHAPMRTLLARTEAGGGTLTPAWNAPPCFLSSLRVPSCAYLPCSRWTATWPQIRDSPLTCCAKGLGTNKVRTQVARSLVGDLEAGW
jgi:hypothetical protein